jgi:hypothetical protein
MHTTESAKPSLLRILTVTLLTLQLLGQIAFDAWQRRGTVSPEPAAIAPLAEGTQCVQPNQRNLYD